MMAAELPKGWAGDEPVRPRSSTPQSVGDCPIQGFRKELRQGLAPLISLFLPRTYTGDCCQGCPDSPWQSHRLFATCCSATTGGWTARPIVELRSSACCG